MGVLFISRANMIWIEPIELRGHSVLLQPLSPKHHDDLVEAVIDGELWKLWYTVLPEPIYMKLEIDRRLSLEKESQMIPFAVIDLATQRAVGMTAYLNIDSVHKRVEIGSTWYRKNAQRTPINTESKFMLLNHAFESLRCNAVEFRTHIINQPSRRGIERLGAKLDGVLRNHMIMPNQTLRDTCVYSIIASEWPTVKAHLEWKMGKTTAERLPE